MPDHFTSEVEIERLKAHFDLAASSLIAGLTNVCTIRCEHLGMRLTGLGLGNKTVHEIGHMIQGKGLADGGNRGEAFDGDNAPKDEFETRELVMNFHMQQIAGLYEKLNAVPEGDGTMADNAVIVYLSDHGDRHHSPFPYGQNIQPNDKCSSGLRLPRLATSRIRPLTADLGEAILLVYLYQHHGSGVIHELHASTLAVAAGYPLGLGSPPSATDHRVPERSDPVPAQTDGQETHPAHRR